MKKSILILIACLSPGIVWAAAHEGASERAPTQRALASTDFVRIEGELSSEDTIRDNRTGNTYNLRGQSRQAMEFFKAGKTRVAVEGTFSNATTIDVRHTEAF